MFCQSTSKTLSSKTLAQLIGCYVFLFHQNMFFSRGGNYCPRGTIEEEVCDAHDWTGLARPLLAGAGIFDEVGDAWNLSAGRAFGPDATSFLFKF